MGIQRKLDGLGRIVLPMEMRKALSFKEKDTVDINCVDGKIILERVADCCALCRSSDSPLIATKSGIICAACIERVKTL